MKCRDVNLINLNLFEFVVIRYYEAVEESGETGERL